MQIQLDVDFQTCQCSECGVVYAVPGNYRRSRENDHKVFYCPNGHSQYVPAKSEAEKLRDKLNEAESKLANAQLEIMAAEKARQRLEKRVKNGVCPCCNKQFVQLTRHMKTKHPEYTK